MTNEDLRDDLVGRLAPSPVRARRMFGAYGLYLEDVFFGVISDGRLYFRTDEESRAQYVSRGMHALQPRWGARGPKTVDRNFEVPAAILGDPDALRAWTIRAAAAHR